MQAQVELQSEAGALPDPRNAMPQRWLALLALLLCLLGIALSIELTRIHLLVHTDPSYHSVCAMSEGVNCETVAISPYSVFAGLPVSVWGIAAYLLMGGLTLWALSRKRLHQAWPFGLLFLLSTGAVCLSVILAFLSVTRIDSVCLFCMGSYAINAALLALWVVAVRRSKRRALDLLARDIRALIARPRLAVPLALVALAAIALLQAFVPAYWRTPGWLDLPRLASGTDAQGNHWIGARDPALTIVEFSDYECPHCRAAHKRVRLLAAKHPDRLRLVHRHLPLDMACHPQLQRPFHTRACLFAEAAECAGRQGHFWEMNDALFSSQESMKTEDVDPEELSIRLGLDRSEFTGCLRRHLAAEKIAGDLAAAIAAKLRGTPTFLVDGQVFLGDIPETEIGRLLGCETAQRPGVVNREYPHQDPPAND